MGARSHMRKTDFVEEYSMQRLYVIGLPEYNLAKHSVQFFSKRNVKYQIHLHVFISYTKSEHLSV
jgi:hypothetical protein